MQTYNIYYESALTFHLLPTEEINKAKSVLIQIFSGNPSRAMLEKLVKEIRVFFPDAVIAGVTTSGEVSDQKLSTYKTLISITTFKKTKVTSMSIEAITPENSYDAGLILAQKLAKKETKLLILYTEGLFVNSDDFLAGVNSHAPHIPVCGGVAADNGKFFETFVLHDDKVLSKGAVGIALSGKHLNVEIEYMSDWEAIGPDFTITKSEKNRIYEINRRNAVDFVRHYLGDHFIDNLPETGFEISLIFEHEGCSLNRNVVAVDKDGALVFTGNIPEKSLCKFGFIDRNKVASKSFCGLKMFSDTHVESIFIFSGMGRRKLLKEISAKRLELFADVASVSGFFGYGEFVYLDSKNCLLNQSCSVIGLSERKKSSVTESVCMIFHDKEGCEVQRALAHLVTITNKELEEKVKQLETLLSYLPAGVIYYDKNLQITLYNELGINQIGIDPKEKEFRDLNRLKEVWVSTLFKETLKQNERIVGGALSKTSDGKRVYIRIKTVPLEQSGEVIGAMAIIQTEGKL